jgi:putative redox protein
MAVKCSVKWTGDGMSFVARTGSGHLVAMDGAPEGGGNNLAPRPMEMVLVGTGGCTAYDVVPPALEDQHDVRGCEVEVSAERAESDPKVFTRIAMKFIVRGRNLSRETVLRAVQLSHEKYCSATAMLAKTAEITHSVEIVED